MIRVIDGGCTCSALASCPGVVGAAPDPGQHGRLAAGDVVAGLLVAHPAGQHQHGRPEGGDGGVGVHIWICFEHGLAAGFRSFAHIVSLPH